MKVLDPIDKHVGGRVRMRRMMLHMSQSTLGEACDVTFQQLQKYEKGTNRIGSSRIQQIANALQVTPAFFFEGLPDQSRTKPHEPMPDYIWEMFATKDGIALVQAFTRIKSATMKSAIVHLVHEMSKLEP